MATLEQVSDTYDYMDRFFRLSLGETADITCAMYDGDYSKTLEQAQADKHRYILENLNLQRGQRLIDIGCGWGPLLHAARQAGITGVGLTLSPKQRESALRQGFEVHLQDWKTASAATLGRFDGVASVGAFEHFASVEDCQAGQQDVIYRRFFQLCSDLLPPKGRLYLQTLTWGPNAPTLAETSVNAPRGSNAYLVAVLCKFYPGSWLPTGLNQITEAASPCFKFVSTKNGRRDYIATLDQWTRRTLRPSPAKLLEAARLFPRLITSRDFRYKMESLFTHGGYQRECLVREVMDHQRMVFEKTA